MDFPQFKKSHISLPPFLAWARQRHASSLPVVFRDKSIILPTVRRTLWGAHAACNFLPCPCLPQLCPTELLLTALGCAGSRPAPAPWAPCLVQPCAPGWWLRAEVLLLVYTPYFSSIWRKEPPGGQGTFSSPLPCLPLTKLSSLSTGKGQVGSAARNDENLNKGLVRD